MGKTDRPSPSRVRRASGLIGAVAAAALAISAVPTTAHAAEVSIEDASLRWGLNIESGGGAYFGGCNFLSAGKAGNSGSSRLWTESDGFFSNSEKNVTIEKPTADGGWTTSSWADKCKDGNGNTVNTTAASSTKNTVLITDGSGSYDAATGKGSIAWDGDFTVVFYGGLTYWSVSDPELTLNGDGAATLTGTASGYGTSMEDMSQWVPIEPQEITLADFTDVSVGTEGFTATPEYKGVEVDTGSAGAQVRTGDNWGSFPQDFVDFQLLTGQHSYWYSSGGAADPKKVATEATFTWTAVEGTEPEPTEPAGPDEVDVTVEVPESDDGGGGTDPEPEPDGKREWSLAGHQTTLGQATETDDGFTATGTLPTVTVKDELPAAQRAPFTINASASDFTSASSNFGAEALGWTPALDAAVDGYTAGKAVLPTTAGDGGGLATSQELLKADGNHSSDEVKVTAKLDLKAPADTAEGTYKSRVTVTLVQ